MFLPPWLIEAPVARHVLECFFRSRARRHLVELDHQEIARCQTRILLGLVHRAQTSRFGRDHDFRRIRTVEDFRRLVPLQDTAPMGHTSGSASLDEGMAYATNGSPLGIPGSTALATAHQAASAHKLAACGYGGAESRTVVLDWPQR